MGTCSPGRPPMCRLCSWASVRSCTCSSWKGTPARAQWRSGGGWAVGRAWPLTQPAGARKHEQAQCQPRAATSCAHCPYPSPLPPARQISHSFTAHPSASPAALLRWHWGRQLGRHVPAARHERRPAADASMQTVPADGEVSGASSSRGSASTLAWLTALRSSQLAASGSPLLSRHHHHHTHTRHHHALPSVRTSPSEHSWTSNSR